MYDSPDYRKLKVSLFNDDKKCDLIGETWIQLDDILERGGGQHDKWHTLHCKGRYAGEIQLELTFWDSRPKAERPEGAAPPRQSLQHERSGEALAGPRQPMKRRPLPAEPGVQKRAPVRAATEQPAPAPQSFGPRELPSATQSGTQSAPPAPQQQQTRPPPRHEPAEYIYEEPLVPAPANNQFSAPSDNSWHGTHPPHHSQDHEHMPQPAYYGGSDYSGAAEDIIPTASYGGVELPQLPPHQPRQQRNAPAHTPKHYPPAGRPTGEYVLPQYHHSEASSYDAASSELQHYRGGPPPPPPSHGAHRASMPSAADHQRRFIEPSHRGVDERSVMHRQSYQDFSDPRADIYNAPSPVDTQLSSRSAPLESMSRSTRAQSHEPVYESYASEGLSHQRSNTARHRMSAIEPREIWHDELSSNNGMPSYATPPRQEFSTQHMSHNLVAEHPLERYDAYEEPQVRHSNVPLTRPQPRSPEYRTPIHRKSVSPAGTPSANNSSLADVAFSPDSFNVLNPNLRAASMINAPGAKYDSPEGIREAARDRRKEQDLEQHGPIVDAAGRVIDPTDHLPSDTWAPEPEKKQMRKSHEVRIKFRHHQSDMTARHSRGSSPLVPQQNRQPPPSQNTPHSSPAQHAQQHGHVGTSPSPQRHDPEPSMPTTHNGNGRQRLQKKMPHSVSSSSYNQPATPPSNNNYHSSPTPSVSYNSYASSPIPASRGTANGRDGYGTPLRENPNYGYSAHSPAAASAAAAANHSREDSYGASYADRGGMASSPLSRAGLNGNYHGPPIPAKIPLSRGQEEWGGNSGAGPGGYAGMGMGFGGLEAEIRNIDIGPGISGAGAAGRNRGRVYRDI